MLILRLNNSFCLSFHLVTSIPVVPVNDYLNVILQVLSFLWVF